MEVASHALHRRRLSAATSSSSPQRLALHRATPRYERFRIKRTRMRRTATTRVWSSLQTEHEQHAHAPRVIRVSINVPYRTEFNSSLRICGNGHVLGQWEPTRGIPMRWNESDVWRYAVSTYRTAYICWKRRLPLREGAPSLARAQGGTKRGNEKTLSCSPSSSS